MSDVRPNESASKRYPFAVIAISVLVVAGLTFFASQFYLLSLLTKPSENTELSFSIPTATGEVVVHEGDLVRVGGQPAESWPENGLWFAEAIVERVIIGGQKHDIALGLLEHSRDEKLLVYTRADFEKHNNTRTFEVIRPGDANYVAATTEFSDKKTFARLRISQAVVDRSKAKE